ncbi:MAG TPA: protein kinase [Thermoanaerobaculia bacterium]|nr:protein kinase [Thermoanaerobaculia bacterium]
MRGFRVAGKAGSIDRFDLRAGNVIGGKYEVVRRLGGGYEGEVYQVVERRTGATRAAKIFYPRRNVNDRTLTTYARKLERLRDCPLVLDYHHSELVRTRGHKVSALISEYVDGVLLQDLVEARPGARLPLFEALHLLHALASGVAQIHDAGEYHGDLHSENVMVQRQGIRFRVKLLDFWDYGRATHSHRRGDVVGLAQIFYDSLGGRRHYARAAPEAKRIIRGLRHGLILDRFPTVHHLLRHLETFTWHE